MITSASAAYGAYKGGQQANAYDQGVAAAGQIKEESLGLAGEKLGIGLQAARSQQATGIQEVGTGVMEGASGIQQGGNVAIAQSGLATSGTIQSKMQTQMKNLFTKERFAMKKLVDTRKFAEAEQDINFRQDEISAEKAYQDTIAGLDQGGALEGGIEAGLNTLTSLL